MADTLNDAQYERTLTFDLSSVVQHGRPSNPHKRLPTSDLAARGSPASGERGGRDARRRGDHRRDHELHEYQQPAQRDRRGLARPQRECARPHAQAVGESSLAPGSKAVELYLEEANLLPELEKLGFGIVAFACTTCNGMSGALDPKIQQEIVDRDLYATAVLSGNRNFDGRIHPYAKQAFLASPPLVVAYAIAGTIRFDIEKDVLGHDDGQPVTLKDIWPTDEEIDAIVASSVKPEQFRKVYEPMFARSVDAGERAAPLYEWRAQSTYIRRPPYWEGALAGERTLQGMRPLAVLGDNITTDHLSPSNAILLDSAAGEYLAKMGLPEEDFNSYATHRGDHLTAQRATFANPTLINEMAIVDGAVKKAARARRAGRQGHADVGGDRDVHESQAAADRRGRRRLRPNRRATGRRRARGSRASRRSPPKASSGSTART